MGMGHRKTSLTLYGMSITITITTYLFSNWNVNALILFSIMLTIVVLPGTGLKANADKLFTKDEENSLTSKGKIKAHSRKYEYNNLRLNK